MPWIFPQSIKNPSIDSAMNYLKLGFLVLLAGINWMGILRASIAQTPPTQNPDLEPKAIAILKAMGDRLVAARSLSFTAISTYESPSVIGPPIVYTTRSEVTLQRPDRLQVITLGDGPASEFYFDGKAIAAFSPAENLVAIAEAPATLDEALALAYNSAAIYFPFTDVIVSDPYKDIAEGLKVAFVVGQSKVVGGTTTDIIVAANDKVFAQIWIGAEDKLPRMIRAVYRDDPSRLRHQVEFLNWQLNPSIAADTFTPARIKKARPIPFARPEPLLPSGEKPPAQPLQPQPKSGELK
jgi:hypothetical protein